MFSKVRDIILRLGTENVCVIGSDERGAMLPRQLKEEIENMIAGGMKRPLMVVATFGTTVLGAIDPIDVRIFSHFFSNLLLKYFIFPPPPGNCADLRITQNLAACGRLLGRLSPGLP